MEQDNNRQLTQISESLKEISESLNKDPQSQKYHSETHCPSCGRFVGTETRCPYCQTETQKRLSIRIFKVISVLLSTLGLLMLLFYARTVKTPEIDIKEIGPLSNFGHFAITGYAENDCSLTKWGTISFTLVQYYDREGNRIADTDKLNQFEKKEIRVTAYKNIAEKIDIKNLPRKGEEVYVEGQISVKQGQASLIINAPEHIKTYYDSSVVRKDLTVPPDTKKKQAPIQIDSLDKINKELLNKIVKTTGVVKDVTMLENNCAQVLLENGINEGLIVYFPQYPNKGITLPTTGANIEVTGIVQEYNGKLEIIINKKQDYKELQKN